MEINMTQWMTSLIQQKKVAAIPVMTHPGIEIIGKSVLDAVTNGCVHYEAIKALTERYPSDAVTVIKDLKVKGSSMVIKRGTKVKSIRLTDNPEEVDCKIEGSSIVLKTCFLKK